MEHGAPKEAGAGWRGRTWSSALAGGVRPCDPRAPRPPQIVCRNCSRNKYPLKYLKDRMAKVCDGCYGELKKRGGDAPGLMRGTADHCPLLPHMASPSLFPRGAADKMLPSRRRQGLNPLLGHLLPHRWFCRKSRGTPRGRVPEQLSLGHVSGSCVCLGSYVWDTCLGHASGSCVWVVWDTCLEHSMLGPSISMTRPVGRHSCCSAQRPYFQAWVPWGILGMRMARWRPEALWSGKGLRVLDSRARGG